jgi:hypothetical protein
MMVIVALELSVLAAVVLVSSELVIVVDSVSVEDENLTNNKKNKILPKSKTIICRTKCQIKF